MEEPLWGPQSVWIQRGFSAGSGAFILRFFSFYDPGAFPAALLEGCSERFSAKSVLAETFFTGQASLEKHFGFTQNMLRTFLSFPIIIIIITLAFRSFRPKTAGKELPLH